MSTRSVHAVTRLLHAWNDGHPDAPAELLPLIYDHLRRLARDSMRRERADHTLQPTALVHEAYLRLVGGAAVAWQDRAHFFSLAARAMRRILVDHARANQSRKRGGDRFHLSLAQIEDLPAAPSTNGELDLLSLDAALDRFAKAFPRKAQVVEMRFFGGVEARDIAAVLEVSEKTVLRDWQFAKLWLRRELAQTPSAAAGPPSSPDHA